MFVCCLFLNAKIGRKSDTCKSPENQRFITVTSVIFQKSIKIVIALKMRNLHNIRNRGILLKC